MWRALFRTKAIAVAEALDRDREHHLKRSLDAFDLTMLGIGAIVGAGIFVVTGAAAAKFAGPGIVLSFVLAMFACTFAALCYAEFASLLPVAGSAYDYSYATMGELIAWIVGWDLVLEYVVAAIAVAVGWSGYFVSIARSIGIDLPVWCTATPGTVPGAVINLPAALIIVVLTALLIRGTKESARFTAIMVFLKLMAILIFLAIAIPYVEPSNWVPFTPFGFKGVITGAAIIFFAYIGFDAISTTAEEAIDPQRTLPISIIASLLFCTLLYIAVSAALTGAVPFTSLDTPAPVADALHRIGFRWGSGLVAAGAITALTSVLIVMLLGQPRIFFAMSRDGLFWPWIARIHPTRRTPYRSQILVGAVVAFFAAFVDMGTAVELTNIGTLFAFALVCGGIVVLRRTAAHLPRHFRCPLVPVVPLFGIASCLWLMLSLPSITWIRFGLWLAIGLAIYFAYSRRHSLLGRESTPSA